MEKEKFEVGCYFDGAFGHYYNSCRIIRFAEELGWVWREPVELPSDAPGDEFDYEYLIRPEIAEIARHLLGAVAGDKVTNGVPQ